MQQDCGADPAHASSRGSGEHSQLRIALQRRCKATVRACSCPRSSPEDGTETHLQPRLIYAGISAKFHSSAANRGRNSNGQYTVATQESVLYSQVNQVLGRTGVSYYRAKAAFSVSFIFGGFARWISTHIFPHRSLQLSSKALYLSKNPIDVQRNFTCRELSGFWILVILDLFMLLYLLLFENVHDRNTVYKKYIFFSLERFSSDK